MKKYACKAPLSIQQVFLLCDVMQDKNAIYLFISRPRPRTKRRKLDRGKNNFAANRLFTQTSANYDFSKILFSVNIKIYRHLPRLECLLVILHFLSHIFIPASANRGGKLKINFNVCSFSSLNVFLSPVQDWKNLVEKIEKSKNFIRDLSIAEKSSRSSTSTFSFNYSVIQLIWENEKKISYCNKIINFCAAVTWHIKCRNGSVYILEDWESKQNCTEWFGMNPDFLRLKRLKDISSHR